MIETLLKSFDATSNNKVLTLATLSSSILFVTMLTLWFSKKRDYKGKHVFISGGSTGIGLSLAQEFILLGASVTIVARTQSKLDKALEELGDLVSARKLLGRVQAFSTDVTAYSQVQNKGKKTSQWGFHLIERS